ncbi:casein kinase II subunit alpha'-interacting protein [Callospermophilus lateralis]|uniref:casein kinase II subunit alpha'-interacting protein n=1 Tax=Callospermophilus lateralis TaxID=76772 RepID=UPI0040543EBC
MLPLACYDQKFVPLGQSYQQTKAHSLRQKFIAEKLNQHKNQSVVKVQSHSKNIVAPSLSSNKMVQSCSILPSQVPKSQVTLTQSFPIRAMKSSLSDSKYPGTPSPDLYRRSSHPISTDLNLPLLHPKPPTISSFDFNKTASSLEANQTALSSKLPLSKPSSSSLDICCTSPLLKSNQRVPSSSFSALQHQEAPSLKIIYTSPSLGLNQRCLGSTSLQSKSQKTTSLDCLWTSLMERNQRSLSSPSLKTKSETLNYLPTSPFLQSKQMTLSSPLPTSRSQKTSVLNFSSNPLSLPLSHLKLRHPHSFHQSQSFPLFQSKSQTVFTFDHNFQTFSTPVCHSKSQNGTSQSDKYKATELPSSHHLKPNVIGISPSSTKHGLRNISTVGSRLSSKSSFSFSTKKESDKEIPWTLDCSNPCIVKGGTIPEQVLNKIVNSISKTRIQKDLSRQILFRRMRGKPNPRPGPRLSTMYTVCLVCASCIKSQCRHISGKRDPRSATLFAIPAPEANFEGKIKVKLVLILCLPENSYVSLPLKENQPDEVPDDSIEEMKKISQILPSSESNIIQGLNMKKTWLTCPEKKVTSQQPQAIDWLLYVKKNSSSLLQSENPNPSTSSSSSSSSSSASSSPSSSSSSFALPSLLPSLKDSAPSALSGCVVTKVLSYHRLPPGVSWLEFICNKDHQPLPERSNKSQSPPPKTKSVRNPTIRKATKGSNALLKFFQSVQTKNPD